MTDARSGANVFDEPIDRSMTYSSRWGGKGECLALTTGDADFRMPGPIQQALERRIAHGVLGYDTIPDSLTRLLVQRLAVRHDWLVAEETISYLPGVVQGLNLICRYFTEPGDAIVTELPIYYPFMDAIANAGRKQLALPAVSSATRWEIDFDLLADLLSEPRTRLFLLCNPHNPLGRVWQKSELERLAQLCLQHDVLICSDEIHCDVLFDHHQHFSIAALDEEVARKTVTLMSPSKAFGMSGLGGAWVVIPDTGIKEKFENVVAGLVPNLNVMALVAMEAAYGECGEWQGEMLDYLDKSRRMVFDRLQGLAGIEMKLPEAAYFLWMDFSRTGLNNPHEALIDGGVELSEGAVFGMQNYLRLNFASPASVLELACDRIEAKLLR